MTTIAALNRRRNRFRTARRRLRKNRRKRRPIAQLIADLEAKGVKDQPMVHEKTPDEIKLDELRAHLSDLQTRFTPQHPEVLATKRQIGDLEHAIESQPKKGRNEPSPTYVRVFRAEIGARWERSAHSRLSEATSQACERN